MFSMTGGTVLYPVAAAFLLVLLVNPTEGGSPCEVLDVSPRSGLMAGGRAVSVIISASCSPQLSDELYCYFDGEQVKAQYQSETVATCEMPPTKSPGTIPFEFVGNIGGENVNTMVEFESLSCVLPSTPLISPKYGNMLGGTPVTVTIASECMEKITGPPECVFDGDKVTPAVESAAFVPRGRSYLCATPSLAKAREISFQFRASVGNNRTLFFSDDICLLPPYSCPDLDVLDVDTLKIDSDIKLSWKNEYSVDVPFGCADICVDINLHILVLDGGDKYWITHNIRNGTAQSPESISYENDIKVLLEGFQVYAAVFEARITIKALLTSETFTFSRWSGVYLIPSQKLSSRGYRSELGSKCTVPDPDQTTGVPPSCPLTEMRALRFNSGFDEEIVSTLKNTQYREHYYGYLHPKSTTCFMQHQDQSSAPKSLTQQCCYDENGFLLVDPKEAHLSIGTPLYQDTASMVAYYRDTVLPFIYCCKEGLSPMKCSDFQSKLPTSKGSDGTRSTPHQDCAVLSNDSTGVGKRSVRSTRQKRQIFNVFGGTVNVYGCGCGSPAPIQPRVPFIFRPMGWGYGEPHIVTLDGFQYTFNGKGEYTYIETTDKSFVIQCRLEHVAGSNGTVFTAIVAKTSTSEAVQLSVINSNDIELCVNGDVVDLSIIRWKQFAGVGLTRTKSGSVVASFTGDYFVEVKAEHDMLSIITMSLPDEVRGQTQGLMGNYNCDPSDDLIPKGMSEPIPANSSFEDVHYDFGLTWLLNSSNESLFCYKDSENFSTFYDPDFIPSFYPSFGDPELERQANEMCKGIFTCLFDVAATGRLEMGMSALQAKKEEMTIANLSIPIVCDPPCVNGACVANDTCQCPEDFTGSVCEIQVQTPCDVNVCQHGGNCSQHVFTRTCECPPGFTGSYCEGILCEPECKFGECDTTIGVCNCSCGYVGDDCSEECIPTVDLCLAVDTSRSIKNFQIQRQNQALSRLADMLNVGSQKCQIRVAAVVHGNKAEVSFSFDDHASSKSLARVLTSLQRESTYKRGGTRPDLGLSECVRLLQDEGRSGKCRQHIIVSFIEGMPNPRNIDFAPVVGSIKSAGIKVVAVGTTARTPREDLLEVALDDPDYVLQSGNFFGLMNIVPDIADRVKICTECVNNQ